jgi:ABC-2 type transport system ATP-binding protein
MIQVSGVCKTYRAIAIDRKDSGIGLWLANLSRLTSNMATATEALKDVSFQVHAGEVLGIFGANGAGKTTLIKILSGLLRPDQGAVIVQGASDPDQLKGLVSYVSTNGWMGLEWQLTADENLLLYGNLFGLGGAELRRRCDGALELVELTAHRHKKISELSAGMRQKVTLARGLMLERPVLYLDEPTVSLDVQSSARVREIAAESASAQGRTVLIASHNPIDLSVCDRILLLHQGKLVALGAMSELLAPLQGRKTLHVSLAGHDGASHDSVTFGGLEALAGVLSVQVEPAQSRRDRLLVRLTIAGGGNCVNAVIDWFLARELPLMGFEMKPVSLQELYEHYVAANDPAPA